MLAARGLLVLALTASVANADYIGLRWRDTPEEALTYGWGTAEVYLQKFEVDGYASTVTGIHFNFAGSSATALNPIGMAYSNYRTSIPGWATFGVEGPSTSSLLEFGAWSATGTGEGINGPGDFVLGTFDVRTDVPVTGLINSISALIPQDYLGLMGANGSKIPWNANLAGSSYNYVAFAPGAFGNPGWGTRVDRGHQPTPNPLLFVGMGMPEPTSLFVIMGGAVWVGHRRWSPCRTGSKRS